MELQRKEEEMRQMFVNKVKETEAELKEKEKEVRINKVLKELLCDHISYLACMTLLCVYTLSSPVAS